MALTIDNCLIPQGSGTNKMYGGGCCCTISCIVTNSSEGSVDVTQLDGNFTNALFFPSPITINTLPNPPSFNLDPGDSFTMSFEICSGSVGDTDELVIDITVDGSTIETFVFDFEAIDLSTSIDVSSIDFGTVNVNSVNQFQVQVNNPTTCCYNYYFTTDCTDVIIDPSTTPKTCFEETQVITITWNPTSAGSINCILTFENAECQTFDIPITGTAVQPPSSGGGESQKNKVDQTTRVEACSPRTVNNRCQTARTMQDAIKSTARRLGKR